MKRYIMMSCLLAGCLTVFHGGAYAQDTTGNRALSMDEYNKAMTFSVGDLDKDTYVKFENAYILDRSGFGKPYFITGDDGMKKRIDLYKLILKDGRVELGTVIYYTTEKGKRYTACMPGYKADGKVWEKYFEDIHAIDKEEKFFVLKLSYVLSKELGFQLYRSAAAGQGKDLSKEREAGTYGNDICFPGTTRVTMADGSARNLSEVKAGDRIVTVDPATRQPHTVNVKELTVHEAKNYAIASVLLLSAMEQEDTAGHSRTISANSDAESAPYSNHHIILHTKWLEATPNHPIVTLAGDKKIGELAEGNKVICRDGPTDAYRVYTVWYKTEAAGGTQKVYNIVAAGGSTFIMNDVMVLQKPIKKSF